MRAQGYRRRSPATAWLLGLSALVLLPGAALFGTMLLSSCGPESQDVGTNGGANGARIPHIEPQPGHENPVIVGEDLTQLEGPAGDLFRRRQAQHEEQRQNNPYVQPVDVDLGRHRLGRVVHADFELRNPREQDLHLVGIDSSCSCQKIFLELDGTRRELPKGMRERVRIPAGAKGKLEVHVEIQQLVQRRTMVTLRFDDPQLPYLVLNVRTAGEVDFIVEHEGRQIEDLFLGAFGMQEQRDWSLDVRALDGKPFAIRAVEQLPSGFTASFAPASEDQRRWRITGSAGPDLPEGSFAQRVRLLLRDERMAEFRLTGTVLAPFKIAPSFLNFGNVPASEGHEVPIEVVSQQEGFSVLVQKAEFAEVQLLDQQRQQRKIDPKQLELEVQSSDDGARSTVLVRLPRGLPAGRISGLVRLSFSNAKLQPRDVRFVGFLR